MTNWPAIPTMQFSGIVKHFAYLPVGNVLSMPRPDRRQIAPLEIARAANTQWFEAIAQADTLAYEAPSELTKNGTPYGHQLRGFVPNCSPEMERILAAMNGRRYLVAFQDKNELWRLLGNSNSQGARFNCSMQITANADGTSGFAFSFTLASANLLPELLLHPADDAQVYAIANNYTLTTYASARAGIDRLLQTA
ncbi:MAG: hypothetical protein C0424_10370 [Sphingobacteriaceae bacterium]|nr:hypothetical protein [Sphingobacteriaceae bacterium]